MHRTGERAFRLWHLEPLSTVPHDGNGESFHDKWPPGPPAAASRNGHASLWAGEGTPAFQRGRYLVDPDGSGMSEHAAHHFHGMVLDAHRRAGAP